MLRDDVKQGRNAFFKKRTHATDNTIAKTMTWKCRSVNLYDDLVTLANRPEQCQSTSTKYNCIQYAI